MTSTGTAVTIPDEAISSTPPSTSEDLASTGNNRKRRSTLLPARQRSKGKKCIENDDQAQTVLRTPSRSDQSVNYDRRTHCKSTDTAVTTPDEVISSTPSTSEGLASTDNNRKRRSTLPPSRQRSKGKKCIENDDQAQTVLRTPTQSDQSVSYNPKIHCKLYQNSNPFVLHKYDGRIKRCRGCNTAFKATGRPNFVIAHEEIFIYVLTRPPKRVAMGNRNFFYHCDLGCIRPRHPYFDMCEVTTPPTLAHRLNEGDIDFLRAHGIFCM